MRSLLFVPGHKRDLYDKALRSDADAIVFDLEDAVPPAKKGDALQMVCAWATACYTRDMQKEFFVRVNSPLDAHTLPFEAFSGIVVPKLRSSAEIESYRETDPRTLSIRRILAIIETPQAVEGVSNIAHHPAVRGLIFGTADLAAALGLPPDPHGYYYGLEYARDRMMWAAKAAGKFAIDGVSLGGPWDFTYQCWHSAFSKGFDGAVCLNPSQAKMANDAFTPSAADIVWARSVLEYEPAGEPVARTSDGMICGAPTFKQARAILRKAGETV